ncbi:hypothetical protein N7513_012836 [Penicillium frequentans]|nr:hypothetical protein N7513_012836 [Penicillium glabrum]
MCFYEGTYYTVCNHYTFRLHLFCEMVKKELDRINDEADCDNNGIPCDAVFSCRPRVTRISEGNAFTDVAVHAIVGTVARWETNIVSWTDVPFCEDCWQDVRIPEVEWELGMRRGSL